MADTSDALGGAYAVESMTDTIEAEAEAYIKRIDEMGGAARAIEKGFMQDEIAKAAYRTQKAIEKDERVVVGLNRFKSEKDAKPMETLRIDAEVEKAQAKSVEALKNKRDNVRVEESLARVKEAAQGSDNLMFSILEAVQAYATLGEISDALRDIFGTYTAV